MGFRTLSIVIPAYNEGRTIGRILEKIAAVELTGGLEKEIVVIDDCSTDDTRAKLLAYMETYPGVRIRLIEHDFNKGKGASLHSGIAHATGEILVVQDADLEYDPQEYNTLLKPILDGHADVVYGSRFMGGNAHRILFFWHSIGNRFLTFLSNMMTNLNLTDMETCYKMFCSEIVKSVALKEKRFGFEPEVTAKISKIKGIRIYEVGISYYGRTFDEGKKISWRDGFHAIWCIIKYGM